MDVGIQGAIVVSQEQGGGSLDWDGGSQDGNRTVQQIFRRHMNFNYSYTI